MTTPDMKIRKLRIVSGGKHIEVDAAWGERSYSGVLDKPKGVSPMWLMMIGAARIHFRPDGSPKNGMGEVTLPGKHIKSVAAAELEKVPWK